MTTFNRLNLRHQRSGASQCVSQAVYGIRYSPDERGWRESGRGWQD